jgi:hypothetical protein
MYNAGNLPANGTQPLSDLPGQLSQPSAPTIVWNLVKGISQTAVAASGGSAPTGGGGSAGGSGAGGTTASGTTAASTPTKISGASPRGGEEQMGMVMAAVAVLFMVH